MYNSDMNTIDRHMDLLVWQKSRVLVKNIYDLTAEYPKSEQFGLVDQMRRAAVSVPSNIAEGFGRSSKKEFKQSLNIARGSIAELQTQLLLSFDLGFLDKENYDSIDAQVIELYKMLNSLIKKLGL